MKPLHVIIIISISLLAATACIASERKVTTKLRGEGIAVRSRADDKPAISCDTVIDGRSVSLRDIVISGFDKPATSEKEALLIENKTPFAISSVVLKIDYLTMRGSQLHSRTVSHTVSIPSGERRMVEMKSFDGQRSYVYHRSIQSRRPAIPFDVRIRVEKIVLEL